MFRAIGFVIALYAITQLMSSTFAAFERAAVASLETLETAATASTAQLNELQNH